MTSLVTKWSRLSRDSRLREPCLAVAALLCTATVAAGVGIAVSHETGSPILTYGTIAVVTTVATCGLYARYRSFLTPQESSGGADTPDRGESSTSLVTDGGQPDDLDATDVLIEAGVAERRLDNGLSLDDDFEATWTKIVSAIRGTEKGKRILLDSFDVEASRATFEDHGNTYELRIDGLHYGNWESETAFRIDMAATYLFGEKYDRWDDMALNERGEVLQVLRRLLDQCPDCEKPVTVVRRDQGRTGDPGEVMEMACDHCEAQLYASPHSPGSVSE